MSEDGKDRVKRWASQDVDQPWSIGEAIGVSMRAMRGHVVALVLPLFIVQLFTAAAGAAIGFWANHAWGIDRLFRPPPAIRTFGDPLIPPVPAWAPGVTIGGSVLIGLFFGCLMLAFLAEATVAAVRDEEISPGRVGRALARWPRFIAWQLMWLAVIIIPAGLIEGGAYLFAMIRDGGIVESQAPWWLHLAAILVVLVCNAIYTLGFLWTPVALVDEDLGLLKAMRRSWRITKPFVGTIWLYCVALSPILLLSILPILGLFALAFVWLGLAYGYVRATGRNALPWYTPEFASKSIRTFLRILLAALAITAGILIFWVKAAPQLHGTQFSVQDMALRITAILSSVSVIVVLLALLLPYLLDRLEGRRFTSFVAARHVRSQKSGFLTVISVLSICGVALSSCALSSVVSVMGGFSQDLKRKILGNNAHIVVDTTSAVPWEDYNATLERIRKVPGVLGATPVVHGEVMASSASNLAGVVVSGIDPSSINAVIELQHNIEVGKLDYLEHPEKLTRLPANEVIGIGPGGEQYYKGSELPSLADDIDPDVRAVIVNTKPERPGVILGRELAKTLHVYVGDEVTLVSPLGDLGPMGVMPRTKRFRVAAIFYSGMYEYDAMSVYVMKEMAQEYFATGDKVSAIDVKVEDAEGADKVTPLVEAAVARPELRVRDWREINKNLFSALKLERFATFIILSIAIMVASFCIVCTLLLMVTEKGKEIAILKAIGASDGAILRTFMIEGMIIGGIGTVFGVVTGLATCTGLSWFGLRLDPEVYYIDRLPISVNGWDFLTVAGAALTICTLSTLYPAYAASRLRPVDGLRYE